MNRRRNAHEEDGQVEEVEITKDVQMQVDGLIKTPPEKARLKKKNMNYTMQDMHGR